VRLACRRGLPPKTTKSNRTGLFDCQMQIRRRLLTASIVLVAVLSIGRSGAAEEELNDGEDITNPVNRFDIRFQVKTLPDATESGQQFDDRNAETLTLRSDLKFFSKPNQLALRLDLPLVWSNKPTSENKNGVSEFGFGDLLFQAAYVRTFSARWAGAIGSQTILPTATGDAFGNGKWRLVPSAAIRAQLPEISDGSYAGLIVRQDVSVAGSSSRKNINSLILEPQLKISLPARWFVNSSPKFYYDTYAKDWFVPLDLMVGKRFGPHCIASLEYQYGLVRDNYRYRQWVECRIGYFF
jgi:hypothetical protein